MGWFCVSCSIHMNARTEGFPAEHCIEIINVILFALSPSVMWLIHVYMIKAWSTNVHHVKSKSDFETNFKMQTMQRATAAPWSCIVCRQKKSNVNVFLVFMVYFSKKQESKHTKNKRTLHASPALVNNPTQVLHLSFFF